MKKAQGISLNVVAGAVIVLVVVIVLIIIFTNKVSLFSKSISGCTSKPGAICYDGTECPQEIQDSKFYYSQQIDFKCPKKDNQICCYSQCKAAGGACGTDCTNKEDLGPSDCKESNRCCK